MKLLGMFAKFWEPGRVKTRLAAGIGSEQAAEVYRLFAMTLLARFDSTADARQLVYAPADRAVEMTHAAGEAWQAVPQSEGDLGERMHRFFDNAFAGGAERVVLIGSDSPLLPLDFVADAFESLTNNDLVLGPSHDGGYYLVGAATQTPAIFSGVDWSTPSVLEQTLALADKAGLRHKLLPKWYDVDDRDDLELLRQRLGETGQWPELSQQVRTALTL